MNADANLCDRFLRDHGIAAGLPKPLILQKLLHAYARLPYENLTKVIADDAATLHAEARRSPAQVLAEFAKHGTGGTCFDLTETLRTLVQSLGIRAEPILADRRYGADTHCALLVWLDDRPHLVDPGYLLTEPIPIDTEAATTLPTPAQMVHLRPMTAGRMELCTEAAGRSQSRLVYKLEPVDRDAFVRAWDASFGWDMMRYPLLAAARNGQQLYLRSAFFQSRSGQGVRKGELAIESLPTQVAHWFGIDAAITARALAIWARRGERPNGSVPA